MRIAKSLFVVVLIAFATACGGSKKETTTAAPVAAQKSLYDRLGGKEAIEKVMDMFLANVSADTRINARFAGADVPGLRGKLIDQVCEATGGPCKYTGKDMKTAHTGMKLTDDDFNALVEDLVKALDAAGVAEADKNDLLGALGGMKGDIVGL